MKKALILSLFLLIIQTVNSQWVSNFGGNQLGDINIVNAKGLAITSDNSGKCYVAGFIQSQYNGNDIVVIKYNHDGDTLWTNVFNGAGNSEDKAFGIVTDDNNNVYVTGSVTMTGRGLELIIIKYNPAGHILWYKTFGAAANNTDDEGLAIALDNNGSVYVSGYCTNQNGVTNQLIQRYAPNGNLVFSKMFDGPENLGSKAFGIVVDGNNFIYITGYVTTSAKKEDISVVKYNRQGTKLWDRRYDGGEAAEDKAFGIAVDETDNIYLTGYISTDNSGLNTDAVLLKYSSNGVLRWNRSYDGEGTVTEDKAWGIVVDNDKNSVYITGQTTTAANGLDYLTLKYTLSGVNKWDAKYNGPGNGCDVANAIALLPGNKVIVTGKSWGTHQNHDYATVKINSGGNNTEISRYSMSGNSDDIAKDVSVTGNNNNATVYVTGYSELIIDGQSSESVISTVMIKDSDENSEGSVNEPESFILHQNFPNPFNPSTVINFEISNSTNVKLVVYDMLGKVVDVLTDGFLEAGSYSINFTNKNLASGIYFYEFQAGNYRDIKKMTLIK